MPSYTKTGKYKMNWLTRGIYDALKEGGLLNPYYLYWIKDQNIIFRGEEPLMDVYAFVDDFQTPYTGDIKPKTLCIKTSDVEGEAFFEARVLKEDYTWETVVPPVYGEITELTEDDKSLPTRYAVKTFIDDRLDALREYFDALENSMREMLQTAQQASEAAYDASVEAVTAANNAENSAVQAESYAIGGTDTRPGENTDNAKYYKEKAQEAAASASGDEETIAQMKESIEQTAEEVERDRQDVVSMKASVEQSEQNASNSASAALTSEQHALASEQAAHTSEVNAKTSENAAKASETASHNSEVAAKASEDAAALSEQHTATSEANALASEQAAKLSEQAASLSESNAHDSEVAAKASEQAAASSESKAHISEVNAKASEIAAKASEQAAASSESNAAGSESNAHDSEVAAAASAAAALSSEGKAKTSETNAKASENAAALSETNAHNSEVAAALSETNAHNSEVAAAGSAAAALTSEQHALASEQAAAGSASAALTSEQHALASEQAAAGSAADALLSEQHASASESNASDSATAALTSEQHASASETAAANSATLAESWAVGGTDTREGEDENNAKYYAELSKQFSPTNKADKPNPLPEEDGNVAALTTEGNLLDTGIPSGNVAQKDGLYPDMTSGEAYNLIDKNATPVEASFGFRTAAGEVSITDDSNGVIDKFKGTTQVQNQLVHDTNQNEKSSVDGKLSVSDAVGGNVFKLLVKGGCVVHNQLVKESISKTTSGTGRLGCSDGVAGNAESFVMTAPRSVVMNQQVDSRSSNWVQNDYVSFVFDDSSNTYTFTVISETTGGKFSYFNSTKYVQNHVYALYTEVLNPDGMNIRFGWRSGGVDRVMTPSVSDSSWQSTFVVGKMTVSSAACYVSTSTSTVGASCQLRNMMCVDLTQYFNGNTTLINSITSWDDLVAYDPTFASYVAYNTGTVKGVTPIVKINHATDVTCPVELFGTSDTVGDTYDSVNGVLTRKIVSVDLGSLTWTKEGMSTPRFSSSTLPVAHKGAHLNSNLITSDTVLVYGPTPVDISLPPVNGTLCIFNNKVYVYDNRYSDANTFKTAMSGIYMYYERSIYIVDSSYASTTIPTLNIYNNALQTSNECLASLSMTYQGREQTITLDPTHTYVFNDNQVADQLITDTSTLDVVGGEDQLVDLTQFYNGDTTRISQIQRWKSLSTRYHRYRDLLPYNAGTVEPETPVIHVYPDEYAYGVVYNPNQTSPTCQKVVLRNGVITEVEDFTEMPCHQLYRCVMDNLGTRHIAYYLDDTDSTKKYNGTRNGVTSDGSSSVLTGADGDVMVEIPISYWYLDEDYNGEGKYLYLISDKPFMGTHGSAEIHDYFYVSSDGATCRTQYVGAYRASVCKEDGTPINTTEGAYSQATGTSSTNKARSIAGALPYVNVSQNDLRTRAIRNNRGSTVNSKFHQWLFILMMIEKGSLNTQSISAGYSNGISNANYCFWRKSGRVNAGNGTNQLYAVEETQDMDNFQSLKVGSTTVQRDTLKDADGRYAWSVNSRGSTTTRYFTDSSTPTNGDTVYSASTGDTSAGTVSSYTLKTGRVIQFQYRGIENPFGEVWEFEHGIQKYCHAFTSSIKANNVVYNRDPVNNGSNSLAWTKADGTVTVWTPRSLSNVHTYTDPDLTQDTGYAVTINGYYYDLRGYYETLSTSDYTGTEQATANNPTYTWKRHRWPIANGYIKAFDPLTFFIVTTGGSATTYLPDYYYDTAGTGSRVVYRGGNAPNGAADGLGYVYVSYGLTYSGVYISGRLSA